MDRGGNDLSIIPTAGVSFCCCWHGIRKNLAFGRLGRFHRHLLTVETRRAQQFPLLRQYASIERSMRMEHPSQRNNGIDGSATQPF